MMGMKSIADELQRLKTTLSVETGRENLPAGDLPPDNLPANKHGKSGKSAAGRNTLSEDLKQADKQALNEHNEKINFVRHLITFHSLARKDARLKSHHISLYMALFHTWNSLYFTNRFPVNRRVLMKDSKIGSRDTYIESLKWLSHCGYIIYFPPGKPYAPCEISIIPFPDSIEPTPGIKNDTHTAPENRTHTRPGFGSAPGLKTGQNYNNKLKNNNKESQTTHTQKNLIPHQKEIPTLEEVLNFFAQKGLAESEGLKFFYYNEAIGWILRGQPIWNWEAAAVKWIEKTGIYRDNKAQYSQASQTCLVEKVWTPRGNKTGNHHIDNNKSYDEPL